MAYKTKRYSDTAASENKMYDQMGKETTISVFKQLGYVPLETKEAFSAYDLILKSGSSEVAAEAECRGPKNWLGIKTFSHATMNVPYRKLASKATWYCQCSFNMQRAGLTLMDVVKKCSIKENFAQVGSQKEFKSMDTFFDVPLDLVLFLSIKDGKWVDGDFKEFNQAMLDEHKNRISSMMEL